MFKNYYFVSEDVIVAFPNIEKSKPFKSGFEYDKESNYFIAKIEDFSEIVKYYNSNKNLNNFFAFELVDSLINLDTDDELFNLDCLNTDKGILSIINEKLSLTKEQNIAYVFYKLSIDKYINPIEMANIYF